MDKRKAIDMISKMAKMVSDENNNDNDIILPDGDEDEDGDELEAEDIEPEIVIAEEESEEELILPDSANRHSSSDSPASPPRAVSPSFIIPDIPLFTLPPIESILSASDLKTLKTMKNNISRNYNQARIDTIIRNLKPIPRTTKVISTNSNISSSLYIKPRTPPKLSISSAKPYSNLILPNHPSLKIEPIPRPNIFRETREILPMDKRIETKHYKLKYGWKKRVTQRIQGTSAGKFDVYLTAPIPYKPIRSNPEILKFVQTHPEVPLDPMEVNMDPPANYPDGSLSDRARQLMKEIEALQYGTNGGIETILNSSTTFNHKPSSYVKPRTPPKLSMSYNSSKVSDITAEIREYVKKSSRELDILDERTVTINRPTLKQEVDEDDDDASETEGDIGSSELSMSDSFLSDDQSENTPNNSLHVASEEDPEALFPSVFTHEKVLKLERKYLENKCFPTPRQIEFWSRDLNLKQRDVRDWFKRKWKAKLDYEANVAMDSKNNDSDTAVASGRPVQKFELDSSHESPVGLDKKLGERYIIDYDNADDDNDEDGYMNIECEAIIDEG